MVTQIKTDEEIEKMRKSGQITAQVLGEMRKLVKPGVSTKALAKAAKNEVENRGGEPVLLGYQGFPDVVCISLNDAVVHGVPREADILVDGDLISFDLCVGYEGMITDSAFTMIVGENKSAERLLKVTEDSLYVGLDEVKDGVRVGTIGAAIQEFLEKEGFGVVEELSGHGVGHNVHEEPNIPNWGVAGTGPMLKSGMTVAIEPMAIDGDRHVYLDRSDGWTFRSDDGNPSAHFEHTVLVTDDGFEILTEE